MIEWSYANYPICKCEKCGKGMCLVAQRVRERPCPDCGGELKAQKANLPGGAGSNRMTRKERKRRAAALKRSVERVMRKGGGVVMGSLLSQPPKRDFECAVCGKQKKSSHPPVCHGQTMLKDEPA